MIDEIILESEDKMNKALLSLDSKFNNVRVGRANPSLLNPVMVEYYGVPTPIIQLATISIPEARKLMIKPYDRSSIGAIEKAIFEANIGLTPNNNGEIIIINIPALTEERRVEYVKQVKQLAEETKIALRNIRQDSNNEIKRLNLNDDEEKNGIEEVQELINKYNKKVDDELSKKEEELMII